MARMKDSFTQFRTSGVPEPAVKAAAALFAEEFGTPPDPAMMSWARAGQLAPFSPLEGVNVPAKLAADLARRQSEQLPLTRMQQHALLLAQKWQEKAAWLARKAIVIAAYNK